MNNIISQTKKDEVDAICNLYNISNYTINPDGSIDVDGNVRLCNKNLTSLPLKFCNVVGDFQCSQNRLTSLEGCPTKVGGNFYCEENQLTSLKYCPIVGGGHINCRDNYLTSLEHCTKECFNGFLCDNNELTSLEFCPTEVGDKFCIDDNDLTQGFWVLWDVLWNGIDDIDVEYGLVTDEQLIFLRYQHYYQVWTPEFSEENMQLLIDDIKEGLI
jgi:hypothetical protein